MASPCNDAVSNFELVGRVLYETPQIKKNGKLNEAALYPRKKEDKDRKGKFTNKISVVRLCRGHFPNDFSWTVHSDIAIGFIKGKPKMCFRGFLIAQASKIRERGLDVVPDASAGNPYHAHIVIPNYDVDYKPDVQMVSEYLPGSVKATLDRLRESMMPPVILNQNDSHDNLSSNEAPCVDCSKYR